MLTRPLYHARLPSPSAPRTAGCCPTGHPSPYRHRNRNPRRTRTRQPDGNAQLRRFDHPQLDRTQGRLNNQLPDTATTTRRGRKFAYCARGQHRQHGHHIHRHQHRAGYPVRVPRQSPQLSWAQPLVELRTHRQVARAHPATAKIGPGIPGRFCYKIATSLVSRQPHPLTTISRTPPTNGADGLFPTRQGSVGRPSLSTYGPYWTRRPPASLSLNKTHTGPIFAPKTANFL